MTRNIVLFVLFTTLGSFFVLSDAKLDALVPSENYTHKIVVDEDQPLQYVMLWKLLDGNEIQFEVHCKTTGWVGLGLSSNGGMEGADLTIGWVKNGTAVLKVIRI